MRSRLFLSLLGIMALLAASSAQAGTLDNATWTQETQGFPMTRTGDQLSLTGNAPTAISISAGLVYPAFSTRFFIPKTTNGVLDLAVSITQGGTVNGPAGLGAQMLTATSGGVVHMNTFPTMTVNGATGNGFSTTTPGRGAAATMGVPGTVNVRTANHNDKGVNQSTYMTGINTLVMVPVSVGVPGTFTGSFIVLGINHFITVNFSAWTPGVQQFTGLTTKGKALPNVTANGTWNLNGGGAGTVTLVSPSKISIDCGLAQRRTASFTSLKLYFVPEPGFLLLLGAGGLSLVLLGSRRR